MKRIFLLVMLAFLIVPTAEAKRRETPEEIEQKSRHYSGWEWGAAGRVNLLFYNLERTTILNRMPSRVYEAKADVGGSVMLNGGYFLSNNWKLGLEMGAYMQKDITMMPAYLTAHYFYGKRKNCLFNFLNAGANVLFEKGLRFGFTGAGGVGFRFQGKDSDSKIDVMLGYQTNLMRPRPVIQGEFHFNVEDMSRIRLNQSVFLGIGIAF